jgi:hypothetical protein
MAMMQPPGTDRYAKLADLYKRAIAEADKSDDPDAYRARAQAAYDKNVRPVPHSLLVIKGFKKFESLWAQPRPLPHRWLLAYRLFRLSLGRLVRRFVASRTSPLGKPIPEKWQGLAQWSDRPRKNSRPESAPPCK